jgi:hypothetical protein
MSKKVTVKELKFHDELTSDQYMGIYLRARAEYKNFTALVVGLGTHYSRAYWSKYERGLIRLTRIAKNELRAYANMPELPMTLHDIAALFNDEDSSIFVVGTDTPNCAVIGNSTNGITFNIVVGGNSDSANVLAKEITGKEKDNRKHISIDEDSFNQLNLVRLSKGISWKQFLMNLMNI